MSINNMVAKDLAREHASSLEQNLISQSGAALSPDDFTSKDGASVHFVSGGAASSSILLIHGGTMGWGMWTSTIARLAREHAVIAVDLPGCGLSGNADLSRVDLRRTFVSSIAELMQDIVMHPVVVVGHSIGGWVATLVFSQAGGRAYGYDDVSGWLRSAGFAKSELRKLRVPGHALIVGYK